MKHYVNSLTLVKTGKAPISGAMEAIEKQQKAVIKKLETETLYIRMIKSFYKVFINALRNGASGESFSFMKLDMYDSRAFGGTAKIRESIKEKTGCKLFCKIDSKTRLPIELFLVVPEVPEEEREELITLISVTEKQAIEEAEEINASFKNEMLAEAVKTLKEEEAEAEASK